MSNRPSDPRYPHAALCNDKGAYHASLKASGAAFRAGTRLTFAVWEVDEAGKDFEAQYGNCTRCGSTLSIPAALLKRTSTYEHAARSRKVGKIVAIVPVGATREQNAILADQLAAYSPADRRRFARHAGAQMPSAVTWDLVVKTVRERKTPLEIWREAMQAEQMQADQASRCSGCESAAPAEVLS